MATLEKMYPAQSNTPENSTVDAITDSDVRITVLHGELLPDAPNLLVLGADTPNAETVLMESKAGGVATVRRGYDNTIARPWPPGTLIGRFFCAADQDALQRNVRAVNDDLEKNKAVTVNIVILANRWANKKNTVFVGGLLSNNNGVIGCSADITEAQMTAAKMAELFVCGQEDGKITIGASGIVPEVDIPTIVTIVGTGTNGVITSSFPMGGNNAAIEAAERASESERNAAIYAEASKQNAEKNGYFYFEIEAGRLIETRTDNVSQDLKFEVEEGRLIAIYE